MTDYVLGFDVGGTGVRGALALMTAGGVTTIATLQDTTTIRLDATGVEPAGVIEAIRRLAAQLLADGEPAAAAVIGSTGAALLGAGLRRHFAGALAGVASTVVLCSDVLTSHAGALGLRGGTVVAAGTGAVALGTDGRGTWRRADGWGVLLGDVGGGAWIGRSGIDAALRAHDGRPEGSAALLAALDARYGSPGDIVYAVAGRPDRGALLASFAPDVAEAAAADDPIAQAILRSAAHHLADTLLAAVPPGAPLAVSATGNLFRIGSPLTIPMRERLSARAGHLQFVAPAGTSLDGAITLAAAAIRQALPPGADIEVLSAP